jgi:hypothetical protein
MSVSLVVLSSDGYSQYWDWFFALKNKYWQDCPYKTYLITETKTCHQCETINVASPIWTERVRKGLSKIKGRGNVLIMLEDYFIRQPVNQKRIDEAEKLLTEEVASFNFEQNYRDVPVEKNSWGLQKNNQVYLNSTQPSFWRKITLMNRLREKLNAWDWELKVVDSIYEHWINTGDQIIDTGYRHGQEFGIKQGKMTKECELFLKKEGLL